MLSPALTPSVGHGSALPSDQPTNPPSHLTPSQTPLSPASRRRADAQTSQESNTLTSPAPLQGSAQDPIPSPPQTGTAGTADPTATVPPPLNIPPSRARRQLAARLAQRKKDAEAAATDPDSVDAAALDTAARLPEDPPEIDLGPASERELRDAGLQLAGLRARGAGGSASRFSGLFGSDDSSDASSAEEGADDEEDEGMGGRQGFDEDEAGRDETLSRAEGEFEDGEDGGSRRRRVDRREAKAHRRPSTTEAKERRPLDDDDDEDGFGADGGGGGGRGPFADPEQMDDLDSSDDEQPVEIRSRRTS